MGHMTDQNLPQLSIDNGIVLHRFGIKEDQKVASSLDIGRWIFVKKKKKFDIGCWIFGEKSYLDIGHWISNKKLLSLQRSIFKDDLRVNKKKGSLTF